MPFNRVHSNYSKSSGPAEYQLHTRKDENKNQSMTDNSLIREKHNLEESMSFKGKPALRRLHTISNEAEVKKELGVTFAHNMGNFNTAHNTGLNNTVNNTLNHISAWSPNTENSRHASVISNASTVPVQTTSIHQPQPQTINMLKETNKTEYTFPLKRK